MRFYTHTLDGFFSSPYCISFIPESDNVRHSTLHLSIHSIHYTTTVHYCVLCGVRNIPPIPSPVFCPSLSTIVTPLAHAFFSSYTYRHTTTGSIIIASLILCLLSPGPEPEPAASIIPRPTTPHPRHRLTFWSSRPLSPSLPRQLASAHAHGASLTCHIPTSTNNHRKQPRPAGRRGAKHRQIGDA